MARITANDLIQCGWFKATAAARYLGSSTDSIKRLVEGGYLKPYYRPLFVHPFYRREDLDALHYPVEELDELNMPREQFEELLQEGHYRVLRNDRHFPQAK